MKSPLLIDTMIIIDWNDQLMTLKKDSMPDINEMTWRKDNY